uniref:HTH_48 domain-containing protein n=1 Tax=Caenorhabditis japonica TaxID=281687 RepID=A0A8R1EI46_CAEJA
MLLSQKNLVSIATSSNTPVLLTQEQVRLLLLYEHRSGSSTRQAADRINLLIGFGTVNQATAVRCFKKFRNGELEFNDSQHSGSPEAIAIQFSPDTCNTIFTRRM